MVYCLIVGNSSLQRWRSLRQHGRLADYQMHKYRGENPAASRTETPDSTTSKHRLRNSLAVIAIALAVGIVYLSIAGWQLRMPDAEQYAAIAARFLKTGQYEGVLTRGSEMATLAGPLDKDQPWPASYHRPGFPLVLAAAFGIGGASDVTCHVVDIAFFALLLWAIYRLGEDIGSSGTGFLSIALLIAIPAFLKDGFYLGLEMCFVALVALSALLSLRAIRPIDGLWAALPLSYAFFVRPTALFFLPLYLILIYHNNRRFRSSMVVFLLTFAVLAGAGYQVEKHLEPSALNPAKPLNHLAFNLLLATESYPGVKLDEKLVETDWELVRKLWPEVVEKLARSTKATYATIPRVLPVWLFVLATIGIVWRASPSVKLLAIGAAISGFVVIVGINLTTPMSTTRHLLPITAMAAVIAGAGSETLLQRWRAALTPTRYALVVVATAALIGYPLAFHLVEQAKIARLGMGGHVVAPYVAPHTSYDDIVVAPYCAGSDVSWYAQRRCVVLPDNPADVKRVVHNLVPAKLVLLCAEHDPDLYAQGDTLLPNFTKVATFDKPSSVWHCRYDVYLRRDQAIATASSKAEESSP